MGNEARSGARNAALAFGCSLLVGCGDASGGDAADGGKDVLDSATGAIDGGADSRVDPIDGAPMDSTPGSDTTVTASDATDASDGLVPVFVAQGYMGRTIVSCDDGKTWVADASDDDAVRCFATGGPDCDHNGGRAMGLAYGHGTFVGTWGWGEPNSVRRSVDGVTWEKVRTGTVFSGLEFGVARFVAIDARPQVSNDDGKTWTTGADIGFVGHIRRTGFVAYEGGLFIAAGGENDGTKGEVMYSEGGLTWKRPTTLPAACGLGVGSSSIAYGGGVIVMGHDTGTICRSSDGAKTWTTASTGATLGTSILWDGAAFVTWGTVSGKQSRLRSTDGITWTAEATKLRKADGSTSSGPSIDPVARSEAGTFVATNAGWQVWYEKQVFYRSTDGLTWDVLPAGAFKGGHPLRFITAGRLPPGGACH
jgi:hypothetical protein